MSDAKCGYCRAPLPEDGVSEYFCDDHCQGFWHAAQGTPLSTEYREPGNGSFDQELRVGRRTDHAEAIRSLATEEGRPAPDLARADGGYLDDALLSALSATMLADDLTGDAIMGNRPTARAVFDEPYRSGGEYEQHERRRRSNRQEFYYNQAVSRQSRIGPASINRRNRRPMPLDHRLFVGGSRHGEHIQVRENVHDYQVPVIPQMDFAAMIADERIAPVTFETQRYRRQKVLYHAGGMEMRLEAFVLQGIELGEVLNMWILKMNLYLNGLGPDPGEVQAEWS